MSEFRMNTANVHQQGLKLKEYANDFETCKRKIREIVDRILASDYTTDDAKEIAAEIGRHEPVLEMIRAKLDAHGSFGVTASNKTAATQEEIIADIDKI